MILKKIFNEDDIPPQEGETIFGAEENKSSALSAKVLAQMADAKSETALEAADNAMYEAGNAYDIANATKQYFWTDTDGVHIASERNNATATRNTLWNSLGILFRKGATNLLAILTGSTPGLAIYDGNGNSDSNIVAKFGTDATIGKTSLGHVKTTSFGLDVYNGSTKMASFGSNAIIGSTSGTSDNIRLFPNNGLYFYKGSTLYGKIHPYFDEQTLGGLTLATGENSGEIRTAIEMTNYGYFRVACGDTVLHMDDRVPYAKFTTDNFQISSGRLRVPSRDSTTTGDLAVATGGLYNQTLDVSRSGKTPFGVIGYDMSNSSSEGGGGVSRCSIGAMRISGDNVAFEVYNHGSADALIVITFYVLYFNE